MEGNTTMPTPIARSTSEAKYMAAWSASSMAIAHICVLVYNVTYLGTTQWRESTQRLPTIPSIVMIDNKDTCQQWKINPEDKSHWTMLPLCLSRTSRQHTSTTLDTLWITTCRHPHKNTSLIQDWHSHWQSPLYSPWSHATNLLTIQQRFDSRRSLDIQYCSIYFYIYPYP